MNKNGLVNKTLFFIGWILSPFTAWNDAIVNIPLSYALASLTLKRTNIRFLTLVLIYYWLTNAAGIIMMIAAGKGIIRERASAWRDIRNMLVTIGAYSLILLLLDKAGILRPMQAFFVLK